MTAKAAFKRMKLRMFPGDIPLRDKIAMLEGDTVRLDVMQSRLGSYGFDIDLPRVARGYKKEFARKANRKVRYAKVEY